MQNVEATSIHLVIIKHNGICREQVNQLIVAQTNGAVQCCVVITILQQQNIYSLSQTTCTMLHTTYVSRTINTNIL